MASKGDQRFASAVVECGFLPRSVVDESLARQKERLRSGERVSIEQVLLAEGYLEPSQVVFLEEMLGRRVIYCPQCGKKYNIVELPPGLRVKCPGCGTKIVVPSAERREDGTFVPAAERPEQPTPSGGAGAAGGTKEGAVLLEEGETFVGPRPFGRYEILGEVSRGGMGVVYRARDPLLDRIVALKVLLAVGEDEERFSKEAQAIARLSHPNVIAVYDSGTLGGRCYYAMEYVAGKTLGEIVAEKGPFPPREAAELARTLAGALGTIHQAGLIHRDLKPSNVMLDESGRPKIIDFGIAKELRTQHTLTETGALIGTPQYMAPEQLEGGGRVTERTDLYALGGVLYYILTGYHPVGGETPLHILVNVMQKEVVPPSAIRREVDSHLEAICLKALAKKPDDRYATAALFAADLEAWSQGKQQLARPSSALARTSRALRRELPFGLALALALLLLLLAARANLGPEEGEAPDARALALEEEIRALPAGASPYQVRHLHGRWLDLAPESEEAAAASRAAEEGLARRARELEAAAQMERSAGRWALAEILSARAAACAPGGLEEAPDPGDLSQLEEERLGRVRSGGAWLSPEELERRGLFAYRGVAYTVQELADQGLSGRSGVAYTRAELVELDRSGALLFGHEGRALSAEELARIGLYGRPADARVFTAEELAAQNEIQKPEYFGRAGVAYRLEDLQVLDLFGHGGRAHALDELEAIDRYGYRGRAYSFAEVKSRGLFVSGRRAYAADQLALKGLFGHQGWSYTLEELAAKGWYGRDGKVYEPGDLESAGLFGHEGRAYAAGEIPRGLHPAGPFLYTEEELLARGYLFYAGRPVKADEFCLPEGTIEGHDAEVLALAGSPDGRFVVTADERGVLGKYWVPGGEEVRGGSPERVSPRPVLALAWDPRGDWLAAGDAGGSLALWPVGPAGGTIPVRLAAGDGAVNALAWLPAGGLLVSGGADGTLRLWRGPFSTRTEPDVREARVGEILSLAFTPDGSRFACAGSEGRVRIWSTKDWTTVASADLGARVTALAWVAEGKRLAAALRSGRIVLVDPERPGSPTEVAPEYHGQARSLAAGDGGRLLVLPGSRFEVGLWDAVEGRMIREFDSARGRVVTAAFVGDGTVLALGHSDGKVTMWRVRFR